MINTPLQHQKILRAVRSIFFVLRQLLTCALHLPPAAGAVATRDTAITKTYRGFGVASTNTFLLCKNG
ncbi:MAG: hypothetical protein IKK30_03225, partial [Clostridia bacterium]|nr:hypothetical protein [Clostridia bacterium]